MRESKKIAKVAKDWYSWSRRHVPELDTPNFITFASRSAAFLYAINPTELGIYRFRVANEPTASIDNNTKVITLPLWYFTSEGFEKMEFDHVDSYLALTAINGSMIHECMHSIDTETITYLKKALAEEIPERPLEVSFQTFNIIEDLYIEGHVQSSLEDFITSKNEILFSEENLEKAIADWNEEKNIKTALNLAVCYKRRDFRARIKAVEDFPVYVLADAANPTKKPTSRRIRYTKEFLRHIPKTDADEELAGSGIGGFSSEPGSGEPSSVKAEIAKALAGIDFEKLAKALGVDGEEDPIGAMAKKIEGEMATASELMRSEAEKVSLREPIEVEILDYDVSRNLVKNSVNAALLAERLRYGRSENTAPGMAMSRGPKIVNTRLHRIATDGKVFAVSNTKSKQIGKVEVVMLVDLSGSTDTMQKTEYGIQTLCDIEVSAVHDIFYALTEARVPATVVAHSSKQRLGMDHAYTCVIASKDMNTKDRVNSTNFNRAMNLNHSQNYDGLILSDIDRFFTKKDCTKVLFVLSDGLPEGYGYGWPEAIDHTKEQIDKLRKRGVKVFSISVVNKVVEDNDKLYGREWNIDASKDVAKELSKLAVKLFT